MGLYAKITSRTHGKIDFIQFLAPSTPNLKRLTVLLSAKIASKLLFFIIYIEKYPHIFDEATPFLWSL